MKFRVRSTPHFIRMICCLPLVLPAVAFPLLASAALGGDMESIQVDQAGMNASQSISAATENYTVYELKTPAGTTVREYLSMSGTVFAVAWQGPSLPDLNRLLGNHFAEYTAAANSQQTNRAHLDIQLPDLVVESNGRVRAFFGRAYLPKDLPQGIAVTDIQ